MSIGWSNVTDWPSTDHPEPVRLAIVLSNLYRVSRKTDRRRRGEKTTVS
jgi:hypothetical protein